MSMALLAALAINCTIAVLEIWAFKGLKNKLHIVKYYTFLQNALALIVSIIFSLCVVLSFAGMAALAQWVRGLRYTATTGLLSAMTVYFSVLVPSGNPQNLLSDSDYKAGYPPERANFILHIFCPLASLLSFVCFEQEIALTSPAWTGYVAIPSVAYWIVYGFLSIAHLWDEPYAFTSSNHSKRRIMDILIFLCIPVGFVVISYVLWNIR